MPTDPLSDKVPEEPPQSPVAGVEVHRFPLVDPEDGQEYVIVDANQRAPSTVPPPAPRGSVLLWSLALHFVVLSVAVLIAMGLFYQQRTPEQLRSLEADVLALSQQRAEGEIDGEEIAAAEQQLMVKHDLRQAAWMVAGAVALSCFISGLIAGLLWRPTRLLDVALAGLLIAAVGGLCVLMAWPLGFALSMFGTWLGRRLARPAGGGNQPSP